jgi:hypothetical protein
LPGFGLLYSTRGLIKAKQNSAHKHFDINGNGSVYVYEHVKEEVVAQKDRMPLRRGVMFIIFVWRPCEPVIPLLYFPAAKSSWYNDGPT